MENPALGERWIEEICERENGKQALKRGKDKPPRSVPQRPTAQPRGLHGPQIKNISRHLAQTQPRRMPLARHGRPETGFYSQTSADSFPHTDAGISIPQTLNHQQRPAQDARAGRLT
jgi:hypothetical protein